MQTELSNRLGVEHAVFGFTPFPAVAAAISRAGGFGVLGAVRYAAADELARDLEWIDRHTDGAPYGLDVVMPAKKVEGVTEADIEAMIPEGHRRFVAETLAAHRVPELPPGEASGWRITGWLEQVARAQLDVAFDFPVRLLANALGSPPADVVERAHAHGILVAALAGPGPARPAPQGRRDRHRRRAGVRGRRPHRGDRHHGAHPRGRPRRGPAAGPRGRRHRHRRTDRRRAGPGRPGCLGSAPSG
ncbi:hypothetical protein SRIMM317S_04035 [Streptomyces rimosus subsp. rimosus]